MYKIKQDFHEKINQSELSRIIGVTQPNLSNILSGKVACRKIVAYCITKFIDSEAEIESFFDRVEE